MNGKMAKTYKGDYVDYSLDYLNKRIYNDLPLDYLFTDEEDKYTLALSKMLAKGEIAKHIDFLRDEYYVTNFGRIINAKRIIQLTVMLVRNNYLAFTSSSRMWKLEPIMVSNGWTYNIENMLNYYESINYPIRKEKC
jgi:hypothetical protein